MLDIQHTVDSQQTLDESCMHAMSRLELQAAPEFGRT